MNKTPLLVLAGAVPAFAFGYLVNQKGGKTAQAASAETSVSSKSDSRPASEKSEKREIDAAPFLEEATKLFKSTSATAMDKYKLLADIRNASEQEVEKLSDQFITKDTYSLYRSSELVQSTFQRWAEINTNKALEKAAELDGWAKQIAYNGIYKALAKTNPQKAWEHATQIKNIEEQSAAKTAAVGAIAEYQPELAFQHYKEIKGSLYGDDPLFDTWAKKDPAAAFNAALTINGTKKSEVLGGIISEWYEVDPQLALAKTLELKKGLQTGAIKTLAFKWGYKDISAASDWIVKNAKEVDGESAEYLGGIWGNKKPEEGMAWAKQNLKGDQLNHFYEGAFSSWLSKSPEAATTWFKGLQSDTEKKQVLGQNNLWRLAYSSPEVALQLTEILGNDPNTAWTIANAASRIAQTDLGKAQAFAEGIKDLALKKKVKSELMEELYKTDPEKAFDYANSEKDGAVRYDMITSTINRIAWQNPEDAIKMTEKLEDGKMRSDAIKSAISRWSEKNPDDAYKYWSDLKDPVLKEETMTQVLRGISETDPEKASKLMKDLPNSEELENSLSNLGSEWGKKDPKKALDWILSRPDGKGKEKFLTNMLDSWSDKDPEKVADFLNKQPDLPGAKNAYADVAFDWVTKDRPAAMQWANNLKNDEHKADAYDKIAEHWMQDDPEKSGAWIESLPDGKPRDKVVARYAEKFIAYDPGNSMQWATTISDEKSRWEAQKNVAGKWYKKDPNATLKYMQKNGFTDKQVEEISKN